MLPVTKYSKSPQEYYIFLVAKKGVSYYQGMHYYQNEYSMAHTLLLKHHETDLQNEQEFNRHVASCPSKAIVNQATRGRCGN